MCVYVANTFTPTVVITTWWTVMNFKHYFVLKETANKAAQNKINKLKWCGLVDDYCHFVLS